MLSKFSIRHYKSLFDLEVGLEPLTVFIGPNGSGKSNICEALAFLSNFLNLFRNDRGGELIQAFEAALKPLGENQKRLESKFWHGKTDYLSFEADASKETNFIISEVSEDLSRLAVQLNYAKRQVLMDTPRMSNFILNNTRELRDFLVTNGYFNSSLGNALRKVDIYDFVPTDLSDSVSIASGMNRTGHGIAYALVDILHTNRKSFDELEQRLTLLVPNIQRIALPRRENQTFLLELIDKYSDHHIPASDVSDGTLRILALLTSLYQEDTPSIVCFEEIENGVHPWLLHKIIELLKLVSTEGIVGKPVQVLITTHSPVLLNYVESNQVRAVELDNEGQTQVHAIPTESARFQKALEAFDGALGELWFTNVFGGNPL